MSEKCNGTLRMRQAGRYAELRTPQGLRLVSVQLTLLSNWLSLWHKPLVVFVHRLVTLLFCTVGE